jgi:hypothetical protein
MISALIILILSAGICYSNPDAKRLYDDLLSNYNRLIRPVSNNTDTVIVKLGLRLSQLIDLVRDVYIYIYVYILQHNVYVYNILHKLNAYIRQLHSLSFLLLSRNLISFLSICHLQNLKDQILTTNVWLEHVS